MASEIFIDATFWIDLADQKEKLHKKAIAMFEGWEKNQAKLVTSNFVLDESFTLIRKRLGVKRMLKLRNGIAEYGINLRIERVTTGDEEKVWRWLVWDWKDLSYTDCTSFALMQRLDIKRAAAFDEHFEMAGFEVLK